MKTSGCLKWDEWMKYANEWSPSATTDKDGTIHFGKWAVSKSGDMIWNGGKYAIYGNRLVETDWINHMFSKSWIDWNEFIPAYFQALQNTKKQFIKVRIYH